MEKLRQRMLEHENQTRNRANKDAKVTQKHLSLFTYLLRHEVLRFSVAFILFSRLSLSWSNKYENCERRYDRFDGTQQGN